MLCPLQHSQSRSRRACQQGLPPAHKFRSWLRRSRAGPRSPSVSWPRAYTACLMKECGLDVDWSQKMRILLAVLVLSGFAPAARVAVKVEDASGAPIKNELVIVQDLNNREREVLRALTDDAGNIQSFDLSPGLYRAIATAPYGLWQTKVSEFVIVQEPRNIILKVEPIPSHGSGDIVAVGTTRAELQVLNADGQPVIGANVLSRDSIASLSSEKWYTTNEHGIADVELLEDPTVLVVCYGDTLITKTVHPRDSKIVVRVPK